jgi:glycosyltransferase involved in cell wall biosynthesis
VSQPARLIVNLSMLGEKPTGLGVYAQHCADALFQHPGVLGVQTPWHHQRHPYPSLARCPDGVAIGSGRLASLKRLLWLARLPLRADDLVYSPTHHGVPLHRNQVITVHDLICLKFPSQNRKQYLYFRHVLPRTARRCLAVFTVSEATRQELIQRWGLQPERVLVVPNVAPLPSTTPATTGSTHAPYLLVVGAAYPHKNLHELLAQHAQWQGRYQLKVVSCTGAYRQHVENLVSQLGLQQQVTLFDYVSGAELATLYQQCSALVYPSMDEGFGIPPLEALSHGKPVIASDIPVHREVLGASAIFVTLGQSASWQAAFHALDDPASVATHLSHAPSVLARYRRECMHRALLTALCQVQPQLAPALMNGST